MTRTPRAALAAIALAACTPDVARDPAPAVAEFDPAARPPRVSEPSFVLLNPQTGRLDFALGGITVPADCAAQMVMPQAQCELYQWLQTLDGFPTSTTARAPVNATVDLATAPGNVVAIDRGTGRLVDAMVGFDAPGGMLTVTPRRAWDVGSFVWLAVRGYDRGLRAGGRPVVASVVYNLLKREDPLTCGAASADAIPESCPYFQLLAGDDPAAARASLVQLEGLRQALLGLRGWTTVEAAASIPKPEVVMLWGFPTHSASVIELNPAVGLAPRLAAPDELRLPVSGTVDPATVKAFAIGRAGTVVVIDTNALAANDLAGAFPPVDASYAAGEIVIKAQRPFVARNTHAILVSRGVTNTMGKPLVAPPISVLLMARGAIASDAGKSNVGGVSDADAVRLEIGRRQLAQLLDDPSVASLIALRREDLVYLFASPLEGGTP